MKVQKKISTTCLVVAQVAYELARTFESIYIKITWIIIIYIIIIYIYTYIYIYIYIYKLPQIHRRWMHLGKNIAHECPVSQCCHVLNAVSDDEFKENVW